MSHRSRLAAVVLASVVAASLFPGVAGAQDPAPPESSTGPTTTAPGPTLTEQLDGVLDAAGASSCLSVRVDGRALYERAAETPLVPASNQKLLTAAVALDELGADHRFTTSVVATAAPVDGAVVGDLHLIGDGDPLLATNADRFIRRTGDDAHPTSLDELADRVAASGVKVVTGRVVGDETRYDEARAVATWPERYVTQGQSGPLSALTVDDGYDYELRPDQEPLRRRSDRPALAAATTFTGLLQARGIQVGAFPGEGPTPEGTTPVAEVDGAPLSDVVAELLTFSDNQTGELLVKELGRVAGDAGTTDAGLAVVRSRAEALGLLAEGSAVTDGSGLDEGNRMTCDQLVRVLDDAGPTSPLGEGLAVAGRTGTLQRRLDTPALADRLKAKTGSLREVTSLAGFVPLASGETATFAMIVNGQPDREAAWAALTRMAELLAAHRAVCDDPVAAPLVAPGGLYAGSMGTLAMFPLQTAVLPGTVVPLHVFEDRYRSLVDRCVAEDEDFGIVLISRGREVGGDDERTDVGSRVRILRADRSPDGRVQLLGGAVSRLRVTSWLSDDPHPWAEVEDWPDPPAGAGVAERLAATEGSLRALLALRRELGEPGPSPTVELDLSDPSEASWSLANHTPVSAYDRQRLLTALDVVRRLDLLDELLADERLVADARLRGA